MELDHLLQATPTMLLLSVSKSLLFHMFILDMVTDIISVEAEGSGSGVVGSLYTLTCTVTLSDRPASGSSVSIQWQGPAGLSHSNDDDTTDNRVVVSQLALDPLTLAHGGDYTCTAEYTVNGQTATESGNRAVSVKSKTIIVFILMPIRWQWNCMQIGICVKLTHIPICMQFHCHL